MRILLFSPSLLVALWLPHVAANLAAVEPVAIDTPFVHFQITPDTGRYEIVDKRSWVTWRSNPHASRFGEVSLLRAGKSINRPLGRCVAKRVGMGLELEFRPDPDQPEAVVWVGVRALNDRRTIEFSYRADPALGVEKVRLLDAALWTGADERGYVLVPVREGLLVPADSGLAFTNRFDTYAYEGCHMAMLGVVKNGSAALISWSDPYVMAEVTSVLPGPGGSGARQVVAPSLVLRRSADSFRVGFLGRGDYVDIARAYREVAREKGYVVNWQTKLRQNPDRARLFGAVNFKLWTALARQMNEDSSKEESVQLNWTFDEAARVAEHLKYDLELDRVLFGLGGWIHRGYDNQHPDILPTAPECGGDVAFRDAVRRVRQLGYVLAPHDNYQDIYRDSPSWNVDLITKGSDGKLAVGGRWLGGRAYLTCSKQAFGLAQRPQNLEAVRRLTGDCAYFIDTTYAAGLVECYDPMHPLTRVDDLHWKQALSDYARGVFGMFGSECGREWAVPHADFFEGLTGVSGGYYADAGLTSRLGATVVPLFDLVYRDGIAMYGKYDYAPAAAAGYVLHHVMLGRPLNYHEVPPHLYWERPEVVPGAGTVPIRPLAPEMEQTARREAMLSFQWLPTEVVTNNYAAFVHFTDGKGKVAFQADHEPKTPTAAWPKGGTMESRFMGVIVPDGLEGTYEIRVGLVDPKTGQRVRLLGEDDGERRYRVAQLVVRSDAMTLQPLVNGGDPALFTRADNGWAAGMCELDRFVKNTYEILSPMNELTSRQPMLRHDFLSADRLVQRSVFGKGPQAVTATVNAGASVVRCQSSLGGEVKLPANGFLVEGPTFVAFCAGSWAGRDYGAPVLFTLRSLDGRSLASSHRVRVFHGFGDDRIRLRGRELRAPRQLIVESGWRIESSDPNE